MKNIKHLLSESAVWATASEFADTKSHISEGKGESAILMTGEQIMLSSTHGQPL